LEKSQSSAVVAGADLSREEQNSPRVLPKYQVAEDGQIGGAQALNNSCEARRQILSYFALTTLQAA
jgi:hypothetical protein